MVLNFLMNSNYHHQMFLFKCQPTTSSGNCQSGGGYGGSGGSGCPMKMEKKCTSKVETVKPLNIIHY